ncbi:MAG: phospholipase D family protein [Halobacteriovoraceae bacterium]|nr:phospholipase D family protein [Halobacteriovoraceae bacterium]MBT5092674.1 phospholipase D family protein [Halobacteriovoraceae bacterium]
METTKITCLTFILLSLSVFGQGPDKNHLYPFQQTLLSGESAASKNQLQLLNSGIASFYKRIDMVRRAKKEIIMEYFIYEADTSGKILLNELIKRAKDGIRVRLLIDKSITIIEIDEYFAKYMKEAGIEVSHYNRALDPLTAQYRTHRKIFAIDKSEVITGGRNIGDDYFDLDPVYNFLDRDVWIKGPIVKAIWDSYQKYWDSSRAKLSKEPKATHRLSMFHSTRSKDRYQNLRSKGHKRMLKEAREFVKDMSGIDEKTTKVVNIGKKILSEVPVHICPKITFVSDLPGATVLKNLQSNKYKKEMRLTGQAILGRLNDPNATADEVLLVSPYFMINKAWSESLQLLLDSDKKVKIFTNSLGSTDAHYVSAVFYRIIFGWQEKGIIPYIHDSKFANLTPTFSKEIEKTRWGIHSKTHIYDNDSFFIGTYNIDNRSDFYNSEMGIFCDGNASLTRELKENIQTRLKRSYLLSGNKQAVDQEGNPADIYGDASLENIKKMKRYVIPTYLFEPFM